MEEQREVRGSDRARTGDQCLPALRLESGSRGESGRRLSPAPRFETDFEGGIAGQGRTLAAGADAGDRTTRYPKKSRGHPLRTVAERYARIQTMSGEHTVRDLCATFTVSRSGYYAWQTSAPRRAAREQAFRAQVSQIHADSGGTYGSLRVTAVLRQQDKMVGHNRVARTMRQSGLQGRTRRRFRVRTTDSRHDEPIAPNRLAELPAPAKPNQIWVTDITYVETAEGWLYLAGVLDLYSRRLVGWAMTSSLETALPLAALQMALLH